MFSGLDEISIAWCFFVDNFTIVATLLTLTIVVDIGVLSTASSDWTIDNCFSTVFVLVAITYLGFLPSWKIKAKTTFLILQFHGYFLESCFYHRSFDQLVSR